ncbi:hypothetical protein CCMA1212_001874 [Trichoderma ghanense]|uniref:Secreted protein n=1 Tax=Trichoderma ghanense TaxID=65468 RepID=A0ABY2HCX4_9HYPO
MKESPLVVTVAKEVACVVAAAVGSAVGDAAGARTGTEAVETVEVKGEADAVRDMAVVPPKGHYLGM